MRRYYFLGLMASSLAIAVACSSTPSTDDGGTDAANDTTTPNDGAPTDGTTKTDASDGSTPTDSSTDGGNTVTLTVNNYLAWCSIKVNNGTATATNSETFQLAPNSTVTLHGQSESDASFYWGYWANFGADGGLTTSGQSINQDQSFTITQNTTVNACCPDNGQPLTQCTF